MTWWLAFKAWAIKALGGHVDPVEKTEERYLRYPQPEHIATDRPLDLQDWGKIANLGANCQPLFQLVANRLAHLDQKEIGITIGPEGDRARVVSATERRVYLEVMRLPTLGATKVAELLNHQEKKERGLSNYGR